MAKTIYSREFEQCPKCGSYETGPLKKSKAHMGCDACGAEWYSKESWSNMENARKALVERMRERKE